MPEGYDNFKTGQAGMIKLTVGFSRNPRIEPLIDCTVRPKNIDLEFVLVPPTELFYRNLKYDEFDVFEMSISEFLITKERRESSKWKWSGLPVFLSKAFMFLNLYVKTDAGLVHLGDLKGKRLGVPDYPMTSALWMRILLRELYEIRPTDIVWYNGRTKEFSHGALLGLDRDPPPGISLTWLTEEQTLDVMLARGELEAAYGFLPSPESAMRIDRYGGTPLVGNPKLRQLFPDAGRQIVMEYFRKKGVLPANHMVGIQSRILEDQPWVALELYQAFQRAKETAYERAARLSSTYLLFGGGDDNNQRAVFGEDPYPLGLAKNKKMIEIIFQSSCEEGLTKTLGRIEDVFYPSTLDT